MTSRFPTGFLDMSSGGLLLDPRLAPAGGRPGWPPRSGIRLNGAVVFSEGAWVFIDNASGGPLPPVVRGQLQ